MRGSARIFGHFYHRDAKKAIALHSKSEYEFRIRIQVPDNAGPIREDGNGSGKQSLAFQMRRWRGRSRITAQDYGGAGAGSADKAEIRE